MKTVLVTAIGSFSADTVIQTLKQQFDFRVIGCDINPAEWLALSSETDKFYKISSSRKEELYISEIFDICSRENVDYLIPLTDPEVDILSIYSKDLLKIGVTLCLADNKTVEICRNKYKLYDFFRSDNIVNVIPTYSVDEIFQHDNLNYPLIAKPSCGRSSEGLYIISTPKELNGILDKKDYIVQPLYKGEIFTVDYVRNSKNGKDFSVPRKELIRTVNGAGLTVEIVNENILNEIASHIGTQLNINGCLNMEFIFYNNLYYLMDINPRFSAGVAFSLLAGYDMVASHINCFTDRDINQPGSYKLLTITRKYTEIITKQVVKNDE